MSSPRAAVAKAVRRVKPVTPHSAKPLPTDLTMSEQVIQLAKEIEQGLIEGRLDVLTPAATQSLMAALCKLYSAKAETGHDELPLAERSGVSATDVMTVASGLLRAVNLAVFELGMWQSWTGR